MFKKYKTPILLIPIILFLFASLFPSIQTSAGEALDNSSLIMSESFGFGTVFSPIFLFTIIAFISLALINRKDTNTVNIGYTMYLIAMIDGFFILVVLRGQYLQVLLDDTYKYAFGGILGFISMFIGLILAIAIFAVPFVKEVLEQVNEAKAAKIVSNDDTDESL